jgi:hypothetical protein
MKVSRFDTTSIRSIQLNSAILVNTVNLRNIRVHVILSVLNIVRQFEFGGVTIGSFDPVNKLEARQVFLLYFNDKVS